MKTKIIILVSMAGLISMASCRFVHQGPRYRHLNKIPANASVSNPYEQDTANRFTDQEEMQAMVSSPDTQLQATVNPESTDLNDASAKPGNPKVQLRANHSKPNVISMLSTARMQYPTMRKHSNLCLAARSKSDDGLIRVVLIGAIIVAGFAVLGGMIVGIDGVMVALFFFIPLFLLALAIHFMVRYDKKKKGTDHASTFVSESPEPEPDQVKTRTKKEKNGGHGKPFPWGILGMALLLAILIPMIGGILLLALLAVAVLAGGVALGLFVYNKLSGKK